MKKLLSLILVCSLAFTAQAKSDSLNSQITEIKDTSQATFDKVYLDIKDGLKGLGSALKVGSEHVYEVLCKQQLVISISWLIMLVIGIVILIKSITKLGKLSWGISIYYNFDWKDKGGYEAYLKQNIGFTNIVYLMLLILSLIITISPLCSVETMITGFLNPEYGAIKDIVTFIK